jgi:competence protein ComFC
MKEAIRDFKYSGESARAQHLGDLLVPLLCDFDAIDLIIPVPLHPSRERERGYNQSKLLAERTGKLTGLSVAQSLDRSRRTAQQVGLDARSRRENVRGAFAIRPGVDVKDLRCVLVDDVSTTGSTLGNCAQTLKLAGAAWIGAVTLAREE